MKVFWSWQSDTLGKIGRHFVRSAIDEAVEALKQEPSVDEPFDREDETFEELHVDQDRQGVAGSPDLAPTIFDKIGKAAVFIADITVVGVGSLAKEGDEPKKLINSNVAVELGYALGKLGGSKVLMVMNEFFGKREHLPFDLRGKGGPLLFKLSPQASKEEIEKGKETAKEATEGCDRALYRRSARKHTEGCPVSSQAFVRRSGSIPLRWRNGRSVLE